MVLSSVKSVLLKGVDFMAFSVEQELISVSQFSLKRDGGVFTRSEPVCYSGVALTLCFSFVSSPVPAEVTFGYSLN
jgi:hypothetical protein